MDKLAVTLSLSGTTFGNPVQQNFSSPEVLQGVQLAHRVITVAAHETADVEVGTIETQDPVPSIFIRNIGTEPFDILESDDSILLSTLYPLQFAVLPQAVSLTISNPSNGLARVQYIAYGTSQT